MKIGMRMPSVTVWGSQIDILEWADNSPYIDGIDLLMPSRDVAQAATKLGLQLGTVDSAGRGDLLSPDPKQQEAGVKTAVERIAQTAAIGGKVLFEVLAPVHPSQPRKQTFEIWKEVYPTVVKAAEEHGVKIAVEPWPGPDPYFPNLGSNPDMLRRMFEAIPSSALGLCYDPSHFLRLGIDAIRLLHEFNDRIYHVHAKDCKQIADGAYSYGTVGETFGRRYKMGGGSWRYCIPGHGDLNWSEIIFHLQEYGYEGLLSIELEDAQYMRSLEQQQRAFVLAAQHLAELI